MYSATTAECNNDNIPKIHLTTEEPPWDPSTEEYSEHETCMLDHQCQIIISATLENGTSICQGHLIFTGL